MYQGFIVQLVEDHTGKGNKGDLLEVGVLFLFVCNAMPGTLSLRVHYWVSTVPTYSKSRV